jgi:hypothetical protein
MTEFPKDAIYSIFVFKLHDDQKSPPTICLTINFNTLKNLHLFIERLSLYKNVNSNFSFLVEATNIFNYNSVILKTKSLIDLINLMNTLL